MLQLKLIALYSYLCKVYDTELRWHCQRFSPNGNEGEFTDQELLCGYLFALMEGQKPQVKSIWKFLHDYWLDWFPSLPSYVGFNRRLNRLEYVWDYCAGNLFKMTATKVICRNALADWNVFSKSFAILLNELVQANDRSTGHRPSCGTNPS